MKTAQYVKEFNLDVPGYEFNRKKFMVAFGGEFHNRIEAMVNACEKMNVKFTYEKFLQAVKEQQDKFWAISNKKIGEPLSEAFFKTFFALHVIPIREKLFPDIAQEINEKRRKILEERALQSEKAAEAPYEG